MLCNNRPSPSVAVSRRGGLPLTSAAAPCRRRHCTRRQSVAAAALPGWLQQLVTPKQQRPRATRRRLPAAVEIFGLLTQPPSQQQRPGAQARRVDELLDELLDASRDNLPFDEQLLGGGAWRVLFTRGSLQLWKLTYAAGRLVKPANAASQDLDPSGGRRSVVNKAEFFGDRLFVTASGRYEPLVRGAL